MFDIPWRDLFLVLVPSLLSGAAGYAASLWYTERKEQKAFKLKLVNYAYLLLIEVNNHRYWMSHLDNVSTFMLLNSPDTEWQKTKYFLASVIPHADFEKIVEHYRSKCALCILIKNVGQINNDTLLEYLGHASAAQKILGNLVGHDPAADK